MFNVLKIYHLFISHSWSYSPHYNTLLEWIDRSNIVFSNYSVPYTDPFTGKNKAQLQEAITEQISHSSIVIIAAGMYVSYSAWIDYEIRTAAAMGKPILAVKPWGNERLPQIVQDSATLIVGWNSDSVVKGIKRLL